MYNELLDTIKFTWITPLLLIFLIMCCAVCRELLVLPLSDYWLFQFRTTNVNFLLQVVLRGRRAATTTNDFGIYLQITFEAPEATLAALVTNDYILFI